jgi:hypothetical protein
MATQTATQPKVQAPVITESRQTTIVMDRKEVSDFYKEMGFTAVHKAIRQTPNGYPFVTFLKGSGPNSATNLFFSRNTSEDVSEGEATSREMFANYKVIGIQYEGEDEVLYRLCSRNEGTSEYVSDMF